MNDENFEKGEADLKNKTREEVREVNFRNRGFNLSYRSHLDRSEKLTSGLPFSSPRWDGESIPELSLEYRFADRLGLKIGDALTFDIQGVELDAKVVNLRKVRWTTFTPNFFILLQPVVLDYCSKNFSRDYS